MAGHDDLRYDDLRYDDLRRDELLDRAAFGIFSEVLPVFSRKPATKFGVPLPITLRIASALVG